MKRDAVVFLVSGTFFGLLVGFAAIVVVSLLTKPPPQEVQRLVENVRYPNLHQI